MSDDDETTDSTEAVTPASEPDATSDTSERGTVHIPQWLAGALVVVLALVIGAVGYAIGASTNDNGGPGFRPINASQQGGQGGGFPGGPGGQQGGPGGQQNGPRGGGMPGGPQFDDRGERGDRQDQDSQDNDKDNDDDQDEDANF
jgi:hypothetical protein